MLSDWSANPEGKAADGKPGLSPVSLRPFSGGETAAFEKSLQDGKPRQAVGQLEELLLGGERHREDFGEAVADPRGILEGVRFGENGLALVGDDHFQEPRAGRKLLGNGDARVRLYQLYAGRDQPLGAGFTFEDAKPLAAAGLEVQDALLLHVAFLDLRETPDSFGHGGRADLRPLADEAHSERFVALETVARHVHVARFEHPQRKQASRKEHRVERENRDARRIQEQVRLALFAPAVHQIVLDPEVIEYSGDDEIDQVLDALGAVVKTGIGGEDDRARARGLEHVLQVQGRKWRLARDENQLAAFLQPDVG